ncbi:hypothetical protein AAG604_04185 [Citromicrobium bathyomarinum]
MRRGARGCPRQVGLAPGDADEVIADVDSIDEKHDILLSHRTGPFPHFRTDQSAELFQNLWRDRSAGISELTFDHVYIRCHRAFLRGDMSQFLLNLRIIGTHQPLSDQRNDVGAFAIEHGQAGSECSEFGAIASLSLSALFQPRR